jgi:hypothetical protein
MDAEGSPSGLASACILQAYNLCSCWIWVFTEVEGGVWGTVFAPGDCAGGCPTGGVVNDIWLYSRCSSSGDFGGVGISIVDASACLVSELYDTGPFTTTHCVLGDRWTHISLPHVQLDDRSFAVTIEWGSGAVQLATENGIANLICTFGVTGTFPGCFNSTCTCSTWRPVAAATYIYVTDFNGDTILDDLCSIYGYPYAIAFPYYYPYGYIPNNVVLQVGLDCDPGTAVEPTTWGHVKALYE